MGQGIAVEVFGDADLQVVETVCTDSASPRARLAQRRRSIPGWPELTWEDMVQVAERYESWTDPRLVLDATDPVDVNLRPLRTYLLSSTRS